MFRARRNLRLPMVDIELAAWCADRLRSAFPGAEESAIDGARLVLEDGRRASRGSRAQKPSVSLRIEGFSSGAYR